ncbi:MAG: hypothetical protein IKM21_00865 [Oscillospiraceae bacterium]|nr:hypothetical protein [Oscillospiraceae bacterium]
MTNSKHTKRALFSSVVALLLCFTMLMGATFAWFTDNVSSTGNRIQAGDLEVDLVMHKDGAYTSIAGGTGDIFSEAGDGVWEPGKTQVVYLGVQNKGNLALKYNILLNIKDNGLVGSLEYAILDGIKAGEITETDWEALKNRADAQTGDIAAGQIVAAQNGVLDEIALSNEQFETDFFALAVHMKEEAGNDYEKKSITIDVIVNATQKDAEVDSFGKDYDASAEFEDVGATAVPDNTSGEITVGDVTVTIPAESGAGSYELKVTKKTVTESNGETEANYDISLYKDGVSASGVTFAYPVEIQLPTFLNVTKLTHNGNEITNYNYDVATGLLTFETNSFSPFVVEYTEAAEDVEMEGGKITAGTFRDINPATVDAFLAEADSKYIAVNYKKNGETYYEVVKRGGKTVVVADAESDTTAQTNDNFTFTKLASDNALYSVFSGLTNEEFSTVYILPGTYNCDTALGIYSNMEIAGIGNAEDVKLIKVKGSNSNKHLFNCNGAVTLDDHIRVTIRNMYLDSSANNLNSAGKLYTQDNAAVQAIRMSKVKCYDLIIKDGSTPFYINGKYDARGAFMYVENITLLNNSMKISTQGIASPYKFYYYNVTTNNGAYSETESTGSIVNVKMDANTWEW